MLPSSKDALAMDKEGAAKFPSDDWHVQANWSLCLHWAHV
jgi:hypothetical protein